MPTTEYLATIYRIPNTNPLSRCTPLQPTTDSLAPEAVSRIRQRSPDGLISNRQQGKQNGKDGSKNEYPKIRKKADPVGKAFQPMVHGVPGDRPRNKPCYAYQRYKLFR